MEVGELIVWRKQAWIDSVEESLGHSEVVGMLTNILRIDLDDSDLLEIKTFKGETILAPRSECSVWSCPKNPGCFCGACHP